MALGGRATSVLTSSLLRTVMASICLGSSMAQTVTQAQTATSVMEKGSVTLGCGYETSDPTYYLFWYKQPPTREMIALIRQDSYNEKNTSEGRYFLNFHKSARSISLTIMTSQLTDSTVYFCALREHRDYVSKAPQLLLKSSTGKQRTENQDFHADFVKDNSSFHLQKPSVQTSDSAVYYCALGDTVRGTAAGAEHKPERAGSSMAQTVTQAQTATSVMEKGSVTLGCGYETSVTTYYLFWYKQPPTGEMIALIRQDYYNEKNASEGRYFLTFLKSARSINLTISASQLTDSAVYFCALREHRDVGACRSPTETSTGDSAPGGGW
ncbi:T-cell receptor alpha chain V region HPB-MLT [Tupaia chinensis]|nr:T-cell receptor alpha chain V region HPB-MLT [Tupaia chinensis]